MAYKSVKGIRSMDGETSESGSDIRDSDNVYDKAFVPEGERSMQKGKGRLSEMQKAQCGDTQWSMFMDVIYHILMSVLSSLMIMREERRIVLLWIVYFFVSFVCSFYAACEYATSDTLSKKWKAIKYYRYKRFFDFYFLLITCICAIVDTIFIINGFINKTTSTSKQDENNRIFYTAVTALAYIFLLLLTVHLYRSNRLFRDVSYKRLRKNQPPL